MTTRPAGLHTYWYPEPRPEERAELEAWIADNECSDISVIGINTYAVLAFGSAVTSGWDAIEPRQGHTSLSEALTAVVVRVRTGPGLRAVA